MEYEAYQLYVKNGKICSVIS